ncbi:hypothetical protein [Streptomyces althioticus]|uniref:HD domain-containing protein n=1 Tax=Streptomyces althioticus TaxID=83380 RepID=UPI00379311C5
MEERAGQLANETARDLPDFTQHDITHTYALWEIANHIAGPELRLNPAEAFVFGGAILVHDLAMSRAAYQVSGQSIRSRREWPDALAHEIRKHTGRPPHPAELASPPEDLAAKADAVLLRALHAEIAEALPMASWETLDQSTAYLINDPEIRQAYGRTIGRVAASHHWNSDEVTKNLAAPVGAPAFAPIDWRVDTLVSACLLRTADAAHLDASRVPDMLAAVRNISPASKDHWLFQSRIQRPYLNNGRLVFTAPDGFGADEMSAWWLAYETLSMVDEELRNTDSILSDNGRSTLSARGVANVESPRAFSAVAPCRDWEPVEAKIRVGDVASLVRRLGGNELYGENWTVGLREIVVNASDAVKARESLASYRGGARPFRGRVTIWLEHRETEIWLSCSDNGIGMSPSILGGKLLDFGSTSWLSADVVRDNPGLLASRFEPSGRFGIGFFSVFMMGDRVQVLSRPVSGGPSDTWVLEFSHGVEHRPILRKAFIEEQLDEPGTTIKVKLDEGICEIDGMGDGQVALLSAQVKRAGWSTVEKCTLVTLMRYLLPASAVDLWASDHVGSEILQCAVSQNDWVTMDGTKLLRRIHALPETGLTYDGLGEDEDVDESWLGKDRAEAIAVNMGGRLELVHDEEGRPAGRISMFDPEMMEEDFTYPTASIVTAGPARTNTTLSSTVGMLLGKPYGAARDSAVPVASYSSFGSWVDSQLTTLSRSSNGIRDGWSIVPAEIAWRFDRDGDQLRCWLTKEGWLNYPELKDWISRRREFMVAEPYSLHIDVGSDTHMAELKDDVVSFPEDRRVFLTGDSNFSGWAGDPSADPLSPFVHKFVAAVREAWGAEESKVYRCFRRSFMEYLEVAVWQGRPVVFGVQHVKREYCCES